MKGEMRGRGGEKVQKVRRRGNAENKKTGSVQDEERERRKRGRKGKR